MAKCNQLTSLPFKGLYGKYYGNLVRVTFGLQVPAKWLVGKIISRMIYNVSQKTSTFLVFK